MMHRPRNSIQDDMHNDEHNYCNYAEEDSQKSR